MPAKRPTLQDIADIVGVTKMTVSRYLRAPDSVAPATQAKIAEALTSLGYIKNRVPAILSKSSSKTIGIIIPSLSNQVFADLVQGVENVTAANGYDTLIAHTGYNPQTEEDKIDMMLSYQIDGLVLTETQHTPRTRQMLKKAAIPVVETMEVPGEPLDMAVGMNHEQAAYEVVKRMLDSGKQNTVYLAARLDSRTLLRQQGYERAMKEMGLQPVTVSTAEHSSFTRGAQLMAQALSLHPQTNGVFCTNDDIAIGAMLHCRQTGKQIPADMAIVGYNGLDIGGATTPVLTSVLTPREEMGEQAARLLLASLQGEAVAEKLITLPHSLTAGETL